MQSMEHFQVEQHVLSIGGLFVYVYSATCFFRIRDYSTIRIIGFRRNRYIYSNIFYSMFSTSCS